MFTTTKIFGTNILHYHSNRYCSTWQKSFSSLEAKFKRYSLEKIQIKKQIREYKEKLDNDIEYINPKEIDNELHIPPSYSSYKQPMPKSTLYMSEKERERLEQYKNKPDINQTIPNIQRNYLNIHLQSKYKASKGVGEKQKSILNFKPIQGCSTRLQSSEVQVERSGIIGEKRMKLIQDNLEKTSEINSIELYTPNVIDAEMKANNLNLEASMMDNNDAMEYSELLTNETETNEINKTNNNNNNNNKIHLHKSDFKKGATPPNFIDKYPNELEREQKIDIYLGKEPLVQSKSGNEINIGGNNLNKNATMIPPDLVILPVYADIKQYVKLLACKEEIIENTLNDMGIDQIKIITQQTGHELFKRLRPNIEIMHEQWIDDVKSRLPYDKSDQNIVKNLESRKPVICILGHVDHGKTTLLDYLRNTNVVSNEAGGITQSIGAFTININKFVKNKCHYNEFVIFDTPGHAAFTGMRQRGAHVVDLAILIISATDGVQPQTKESLAIIRKEKLPFIVALNKIDRLEADPKMVRRQLNEIGIDECETEIIEISAKKGINIDVLLENIDTLCELHDPIGNFKDNAELVVIEAKKNAKEGTIVNALVQDGCLKQGSTLLQIDNDSICERVTRLQNDKNELLEYAYPGTPVSFLGFKELPAIGSILIETNNLENAQQIIKMREKHKYYRDKILLNTRLSNKKRKLFNPILNKRGLNNGINLYNENEDNLILESQYSTVNDSRCLNIWIRADTWGSIEAIEHYLSQLIIPENEYYFKVVGKDVSNIDENLLRMSDEKNCYILGFNVAVIDEDNSFKKGKKGEKPQKYQPKHVETFTGNVIFQLFEEFLTKLQKKLKPIEKHILCGKAQVREMFHIKIKTDNDDIDEQSIKKNSKQDLSKKQLKTGTVAGLVVDNGKMVRNGHYKISRDGEIIYEQMGASDLKRFAKNALMVEQGEECGLRLEFDDWKINDIIECYDIEYHKNTISMPEFDLDNELKMNLYNGRNEVNNGFTVNNDDYYSENFPVDDGDDGVTKIRRVTQKGVGVRYEQV